MFMYVSLTMRCHPIMQDVHQADEKTVVSILYVLRGRDVGCRCVKMGRLYQSVIAL